MKYILIVLIFIPFITKSQTVDYDTIRFNFSEVVKVDSITANELFSNAKLFIAKKFNSGKSVTQLNDEDSHTLLIKGLLVVKPISKLPYSFSYIKEFQSPFTFSIECKDNRYRYSIEDLDSELYLPYTKSKGEIGKKAHKELLDIKKISFYNYIVSFIDQFKESMKRSNNF